MMPHEFTLIASHFRPLAGPGALDLEDDAAVLSPPPGRELVIAADAMVAGVHFLPDDPPDLVGRKLLRVNLSDLAAMSADPLGYLMTIAAPHGTPDDWFAAFAAGLASDQRDYGITLLGGDTTATPGPLTLSLTILGHVAPGTAVRRRGAAPGDSLWVTGTIGDGTLGLRAARGDLPDPDGFLAGRYRLPQPRIALRLAGLASAAMDVSDGLVQDIGHLCRAGGLSAELDMMRVPRSRQAIAAAPSELLACLTGGDDYELVFSLPPGRDTALAAEAARADVPVTRIGRFLAGPPVVCVLDAAGHQVPITAPGWSHF